jgi:hypothetical protein
MERLLLKLFYNQKEDKYQCHAGYLIKKTKKIDII